MNAQPLAAAPAAGPLRIAVVGHTNAGKTSLLRTLTRRRDFGEVSARPGATRQTEAVDLVVQGKTWIEYWDTPGLEDAVALEAALTEPQPGAARDTRADPASPAADHGAHDALTVGAGAMGSAVSRPGGTSTPAQRLQAFLQSPLARGEFEQEAKVIRAMLADLDAAMLVIDCREPVLPKYRAECRLLVACAKPIFPVLNHAGAPGARPGEWLQSLREAGLHAHAVFDAVAPFAGAEQTLYADLASLLPARRAQLTHVREALRHEAGLRQRAACQIAAHSLLELAGLREVVAVEALKQPRQKQLILDGFQRRVMQALQAPQARLLDLYGFDAGDARMAALGNLAGEWADDLFNPEVLKQVGLRLGTGAAIGAAVGVAADLALAGLSLGAGAALGATVGGIASQGWKPAWTVLRQRLQGEQLVRLDDAALCLLAQRWLALIAVLGTRGHANATPQIVGDAGDVARTQAGRDRAGELLKLLHTAMAQALTQGSAARLTDDALADAVTDWLQHGLQPKV
ncbi:hypothetical protein CCO03_12980 [Comamonas serinivorans]|uniref:G domain-containing protein n=1 Tax=Comamonas serinivorans TaxID=1082851 RepID=A0A1Y0EPB7_9BURK|nr:GTPase/DUF3482 domain-containing protein [Comamonas serinivorans]ARU05477.1 hypothetical protein CCO03_12980 [Comamonas serinivorans]